MSPVLAVPEHGLMSLLSRRQARKMIQAKVYVRKESRRLFSGQLEAGNEGSDEEKNEIVSNKHEAMWALRCADPFRSTLNERSHLTLRPNNSSALTRRTTRRVI